MGRVLAIGDAGQSSGQRRVDVNIPALAGGIIRVRSRLRPVGLSGAVVDEPGRNRVIHRVAYARGGGGVAGEIVRVVAQRRHLGVVRREGVGEGFGIRVAFLEDSISREADRFVARGRHVVGGVFAAIDVTHRPIGVVGRPGVIHADRKTEEVARLGRRMRCIHPDGGERSFVPNAGDTVGGGGADVGTRAANEPQQQRVAGQPNAALWPGRRIG